MLHNEHGSITIVALGLAALAMVLTLLTADVAVFLASRAQAQLAADAAALAAAPVTFLGGDAARVAASTAGANGAHLTECDCQDDSSWRPRTVAAAVTVAVELSLLPDMTVGASARAVFDPVRLRG